MPLNPLLPSAFRLHFILWSRCSCTSAWYARGPEQRTVFHWKKKQTATLVVWSVPCRAFLRFRCSLRFFIDRYIFFPEVFSTVICHKLNVGTSGRCLDRGLGQRQAKTLSCPRLGSVLIRRSRSVYFIYLFIIVPLPLVVCMSILSGRGRLAPRESRHCPLPSFPIPLESGQLEPYAQWLLVPDKGYTHDVSLCWCSCI